MRILRKESATLPFLWQENGGTEMNPCRLKKCKLAVKDCEDCPYLRRKKP